MPYSIVKKNDQWCVVKKATGKQMGCHPSEEKAAAQLAALNIAEHKKGDVALEQRAERPPVKLESVRLPWKNFDLAATRADVLPNTIKTHPDGSLTMRLRIASSYPVSRAGYLDGDFEEFEEVLSFEAGAHRAGRLESGRAPLLACHQQFELGAVLGVLSNPRSTSTGGYEGYLECDALVSGRAELEGVRQDLVAGILTNVSIGYRVYQYRDVTERPPAIPGPQSAPAAKPTRRLLAIDWETREASLLPIGADPTASVRSADPGEPHDVVLWTQPLRKMEPDELDPASGMTATAPPPPTETPARAAPPPPLPQPITPSAPPLPSAAEERARQASIRQRLLRAGLPQSDDFARSLLDQDVAAPAAAERILDLLASRDAAPEIRGNVRVEDSDEEKSMRQMEDAFTSRIMLGQLTPTEQRELGGRLQGNRYAHATLLEIGEDYLRRFHGRRIDGLPRIERAQRILFSRHTSERAPYLVTADFPSVLANVAAKSMRRQFDLTRETYTQWTVPGTLQDFKQASRPQLSEAARLIRVPEGAEYQYGAMGDTGEPIQLLKYGRIIPLSMEAMVNDDLGAFARIPRSFGGMARQLIADLVYAHLTANTVMSDGFGIFDATNHGNHVTGAGNAFTSANALVALSNVRVLARRQKAVPSGSGETPPFISVDLVHLRVPEHLETVAQQVTTGIQAQQIGNVNPFQGIFESVMAEPRLGADSAAKFYLMSNPAIVETIEVAFLAGESGPVIESRIGFTTDGTEIKCRLVVGTSPIEYRGLYKNDGAT